MASNWMRSLGASALLHLGTANAAPELNLDRAFADTKFAVRSGRGADILVIGDSLSFSVGFEPDSQASYVNYFRRSMQAAYGDGGAGYQAISLWTGAGFNQGWTRSMINADSPPYHALDGLWASSSSSPFPPVWTNAYFDALSRVIELHYLRQPDGGRFEMRAEVGDGALIATIDTSGPWSVATYKHEFSTDNRRIWYQPRGDGPITILGQVNTERPRGVRVHRAANGGWGVGNFLQRDESFDEQIRLIAPDLIFIALGQNDQNQNRDEYPRLFEKLIYRLKLEAPEAEIVLIGTYNTGFAIGEIIKIVEKIAEDLDLGFLNMYELGGTHQFLSDQGFLIDGTHSTQAGAEYFGKILFDAFQKERGWRYPRSREHCFGFEVQSVHKFSADRHGP